MVCSNSVNHINPYMPASKVTVKATFMEDNSMLNFFVDVPAEACYYDAVLWAAKNTITSGTTETTSPPPTHPAPGYRS